MPQDTHPVSKMNKQELIMYIQDLKTQMYIDKDETNELNQKYIKLQQELMKQIEEVNKHNISAQQNGRILNELIAKKEIPYICKCFGCGFNLGDRDAFNEYEICDCPLYDKEFEHKDIFFKLYPNLLQGSSYDTPPQFTTEDPQNP